MVVGCFEFVVCCCFRLCLSCNLVIVFNSIAEELSFYNSSTISLFAFLVIVFIVDWFANG